MANKQLFKEGDEVLINGKVTGYDANGNVNVGLTDAEGKDTGQVVTVDESTVERA